MFVPAAGNGPQDAAGQGRVWPSMDPITYREAREIAGLNNMGMDCDGEVRRWIVIVLTVAHVTNDDPADCRDENLAALCQRCHNRHDSRSRRKGIRARRHVNQGTLTELFS
jgi:hypothetical protein